MTKPHNIKYFLNQVNEYKELTERKNSRPLSSQELERIQSLKQAIEAHFAERATKNPSSRNTPSSPNLQTPLPLSPQVLPPNPYVHLPLVSSMRVCSQKQLRQYLNQNQHSHHTPSNISHLSSSDSFHLCHEPEELA